MVSYNDVANLPLGELLASTDKPLTFPPDVSAEEAIQRLGQRNQNIALLRLSDANMKSFSRERLIDAVRNLGVSADKVLVSEVLGQAQPDDVYQVSATAPLSGLTQSGNSAETLLVTNPETGQPEAVIERKQLASRIRGLVS